MNGIELSRAFFEEYGRPMLEREFPELLPHLSAGLIGAGSECFGFDDEVSQDHDFEPGFCLFLPGEEEVDRRQAFLLERAYAKLPREFEGFVRPLMQPVGGARRGVIRLSDFLLEKTGTPDGELTLQQWLSVPSQSLAECVNGTVFFDGSQALTAARTRLARYPEDVFKKKLAGYLLLMAQSGQYNYGRCLAHGENAAAQLAVGEFVKSAISALFLLNGVYEPYYKWSFRALRALPTLSYEAELLEYLLTSDNAEENAEEKEKVIEGIAMDIIDLLMERGLTKATCGDLEKHAYSVNDGIADGWLRNLHILAAV